jgi:hypothetical protein
LKRSFDMTIKWSGFPTPVDATSSDILVGLENDTTNARLNASSFLFVSNNLSDVTSKTTSFNNLSPLTTKGDLIWFDGTNNTRLGIGTLNQILSVGASNAINWINNPSLLISNNLSDVANVTTSLNNLGLGVTNDVTFNNVTAGVKMTATAFVSTTGINALSFANTLTAHSGGGQGSALALTKQINQITTVAASGDSVLLPTAVAGLSIIVINANATNPMDCFPFSGQSINALSANTALSIAANKTVIFFCSINGTWNSIVTA